MCERWYGAIGRTRSSTQYLILACGLLDFHGFRGVTDFHPLLLFREEKKEKSRLFPRQPVKRHARWILYVFNQVSAPPPLPPPPPSTSSRLSIAKYLFEVDPSTISIDLYRWQEIIFVGTLAALLIIPSIF